jgi:hypothetical protein
MSTRLLSPAARLSDQELVVRVKELAHQERSATAALVAHLAVFDERRLHLAEGFASLFAYCTQVLHLSEHATYNRIEAARAVRRFPVILDRLASGDLHLTSIRLLAPHLTQENHLAVLDEARHLKTRGIEEIVARLQPRPPVPPAIRRLPALRGPAILSPGDAPHQDEGRHQDEGVHDADGLSGRATAALDGLDVPSHRLPSLRRAVVGPLAPGQFRVQFTADEETRDMLRQAQDLLRHRIPDGDLSKVIHLALTALLKDLAKQKHAATDRPRTALEATPADIPPRSRHIPAAVKRAVWVRDGGQCAFVALDGQRCSERGFVEFHHVTPFAVGGTATVDNLQLRCRAHNGFEAERHFGGQIRAVREPHR